MDNEDLSRLEYYYEKQDEITKACLLALKSIILSVDEHIVHFRKYQIPFFRYKEFNLSFLWVHRKKIIVGFVQDKKTLNQTYSKRGRDFVETIILNPMEDIPCYSIQQRLQNLIEKYNQIKA